MVPENIDTPTTEGHWKFRGEGGAEKAKIFKGKYEPKLEFPEGCGGGGGFKPKDPPWGEYGYFLEQHIPEVSFVVAPHTWKFPLLGNFAFSFTLTSVNLNYV